MPDYNSLIEVNQLLSDAQEAEFDNREKVREDTHFLKKEDGQWEPEIIQNMTGRPRYTFDKCNPVVDSIAGELEQAEFGIKVRPAAGEASKETAQLYDGMVRNIQSMSNAKNVFNASGRKMVEVGFDAWRVVADWADGFEQDLFIKKIANVVDRVWFDTGAEMQDMSDANWCFVLQAVTKTEYEERWPEGSGQSISDDRTSEVYAYKPNFITVGEFLWKDPVEIEVVLMSNNAVYEVDDDFESVVDELKAQGITETRRRKKKSHIVKTRLFDGSDWLSEAKETVFSFIPVIPTYGNFDISEDKVIYRGAINKLKDSQRVYNYAQSRATEEGALAPRAKYWMTNEQAIGHESTLQTMNTNANPIQTYSHVPDHPQPYWQGGAQINPGLQQTSADMSKNIIESSGIFSANQGDAPRQSGYAIELQQNKGDNSSIKYFTSQEIAICHTFRVIKDAIPKVYDKKRTVRILGEDGESKMETINDEVFDNETGKMVSLNDLRKGKYDVTCDVGPAFKNRQQETVRAFNDILSTYPQIMDQGADVYLRNIQAPGTDLIADRIRKQMFESGRIPDDQMTDEEKEAAQAMIEAANANPPQPSAIDVANMELAQANTADTISKAQERENKAVLADRKADLEEQKFAAQLNQKQFENLMAEQKQAVEAMNKAAENLNTQANSLKTLKDAMGVDTIVGPTNTEAYKNQAEIVTDTQEQAE